MTEKNTDIKCIDCEEPAQFFHSKCCMAHMEGVITPTGEFQIVCEKCGKYVGTIINPKKDIVKKDAELLVEYLNWLEDESKVHYKLKAKDEDATERVSKIINVLDKLANLAEQD